MAYSIKIVKKELQKTSEWSGGTTTELYIYPEGSDYKKRDFLWRLSSATVNLEESTFTHLPEVQRIIMVLEGEMKLKHEGHYTVDLTPFKQDTFDGSFTTKSFGKVKDFNLMMKEGCKGKIKALDFSNDLEIDIKNHEIKTAEAFYSLSDDVEIIINDKEKVCLNKNDLMLINIDNNLETIHLSIINNEGINKKLIRASIKEK